jgi:hypothetical protein
MSDLTFSVAGRPGATFRFVAGDTAVGPWGPYLTDARGKKAVACLLTCEDNDARFAMGGTIPTQGAAGVGHVLAEGGSVRITHSYAIYSGLIVNAVNGSDAVIQATIEYEE